MFWWWSQWKIFPPQEICMWWPWFDLCHTTYSTLTPISEWMYGSFISLSEDSLNNSLNKNPLNLNSWELIMNDEQFSTKSNKSNENIRVKKLKPLLRFLFKYFFFFSLCLVFLFKFFFYYYYFAVEFGCLEMRADTKRTRTITACLRAETNRTDELQRKLERFIYNQLRRTETFLFIYFFNLFCKIKIRWEGYLTEWYFVANFLSD